MFDIHHKLIEGVHWRRKSISRADFVTLKGFAQCRYVGGRSGIGRSGHASLDFTAQSCRWWLRMQQSEGGESAPSHSISALRHRARQHNFTNVRRQIAAIRALERRPENQKPPERQGAAANFVLKNEAALWDHGSVMRDSITGFHSRHTVLHRWHMMLHCKTEWNE